MDPSLQASVCTTFEWIAHVERCVLWILTGRSTGQPLEAWRVFQENSGLGVLGEAAAIEAAGPSSWQEDAAAGEATAKQLAICAGALLGRKATRRVASNWLAWPAWPAWPGSMSGSSCSEDRAGGSIMGLMTFSPP